MRRARNACCHNGILIITSVMICGCSDLKDSVIGCRPWRAGWSGGDRRSDMNREAVPDQTQQRARASGSNHHQAGRAACTWMTTTRKKIALKLPTAHTRTKMMTMSKAQSMSNNKRATAIRTRESSLALASRMPFSTRCRGVSRSPSTSVTQWLVTRRPPWTSRLARTCTTMDKCKETLGCSSKNTRINRP